jgi:RNA polymerase sigma-70 factor (subfamily 1)
MATSTDDRFSRLLERARDGSASALGRLLDRHRRWLRALAARRLPPALAARHDPSDLVQECLTAAASRFQRFEGEGPGRFRGWLRDILDRRIKRVFRYWGQDRRDTRRETRPEFPEHQPAPDDGDALSRLARSEDQGRQRELFRRAIAVLDDQDRRLLDLRIQQGMSHDEVAERLGIATGTARQRFARVVAKLKEVIEWLDLWDRRGAVPLKAEALALWRFRSMPPADVARQLGLPPDAVACWIEEERRLIKPNRGGSP